MTNGALLFFDDHRFKQQLFLVASRLSFVRNTATLNIQVRFSATFIAFVVGNFHATKTQKHETTTVNRTLGRLQYDWRGHSQ